MDGQLPTESPVKSSNTSLLLAISTIVFLVISAYLFLQNRELKSTNIKQETPKTSTETIEAKPRSTLFPFDPQKPYVTSTVIYQQVSGKVIAYDTNTYSVTLEKFGEQFKIKLPLGPDAAYTPPGFADVSGMRSF